MRKVPVVGATAAVAVAAAALFSAAADRHPPTAASAEVAATTDRGAPGQSRSAMTAAPAPTLTLSATPTRVAAGGRTTLTWASTGAHRCVASGGWTGARAVSASRTVPPLRATSTYVLTCSGPGGSVAKEVTVTVGGGGGGGGGTGAIRVSADGHSLEYADGKPFFLLGDTAWLLLWEPNLTDATRYLEQRGQTGYNSALVMVAATYKQANANGDTAFVGGDKSRPNEAFFAHLDRVLAAAEQNGMNLALVPAWANSDLGSDNDFTASQARAYGQFLGNRYKARPNVIWVLGGDGEGPVSVYKEIFAGLRAAGDTHLVTWHPSSCCSSRGVLPNTDPTLSFNLVQSGHANRDVAPTRLSADYKATPAKPVINAEPNYEHHPIGWNPANGYFTELDVRHQAYWNVFAGAAGHIYGSHSIWQFWRPGSQVTFPFLGRPENDIAWYDAVKDDGSMDMQHVRSLMLSRPFAQRVPDGTLITAGQAGGGGRVSALRDSDNRYAMVYFPSRKAVSVDLARVGGPTVKAWWYDPRTGQASDAGSFPNTGTRSFQPATAGDWVLVLDDADQGYAAPGR